MLFCSSGNIKNFADLHNSCNLSGMALNNCYVCWSFFIIPDTHFIARSAAMVSIASSTWKSTSVATLNASNLRKWCQLSQSNLRCVSDRKEEIPIVYVVRMFLYTKRSNKHLKLKLE